MKRLFHPTGNAWRDVADDKAASWEKAGWLSEKPSDFKDTDSLEEGTKVGEGYVAPSVPKNEDPTPAVPENEDPTPASELDAPASNASTDDWKRYALGQGATEDDLEGQSRNEIREAYGPQA